MPGTDWLRSHSVEVAWSAFAVANVAAMIAWPTWETIPFHFLWISLTLLYGFRVWAPRPTSLILVAVAVATGASILADAFAGIQLWGELFEVPLMSAMFLAMVWHARRRLAAVAETEELLARQERFLHDASHELRTPVTIARGHLELLRKHRDAPELTIALDELTRIERIVSRLLLLANAAGPDFLAASAVEVEPFVEDVFMRWSEVAQRGWRLGPLARVRVWADEEALRIALDALVENAVKYTEPHETIELRAVSLDFGVAIEVVDSGCGVAPARLDGIFERFARGDDARTRQDGGAGLGLAIVSAIAKAHGGVSTATPRPRGTAFSIWLPILEPSKLPLAAPRQPAPAGAP